VFGNWHSAFGISAFGISATLPPSCYFPPPTTRLPEQRTHTRIEAGAGCARAWSAETAEQRASKKQEASGARRKRKLRKAQGAVTAVRSPAARSRSGSGSALKRLELEPKPKASC
jgi:hypothetical protein